MKYYTDKQIFYVDSHNRLNQNDSHTNFTFTLDINVNIEYDSVVVLDASIPKSNYVVSNSMNTVSITEPSGTRTITMNIGNYNRRSFKNDLTTLLNNNVDNFVYVITYNNITNTCDNGHYTFTVSGNTGYQPTFLFTNCLYEQMGFNKNTSYTFSGNTLESVNIMNFRPKSTYYILSNIVQNKSDNILCDIMSQQSSDFEYITYRNQAPAEYSKIFARGNSNIFQFIITDEDFNQVDLNGLNVVFTIMLFKENNIDKLLKGFIKYITMKE